MTTPQVIDLIARYHHLLALESAHLAPVGFVEAWVNSQDEVSWAVLHEYMDRHRELVAGAAKDLKDEEPAQTTQPPVVKSTR